MKYIVIELQTATDGTVANLVYAFDDRNEAEQKYHLILASAAVSTIPAHAAVLITSEGITLMHACYHHAQPEPEPAPEIEPEVEPEGE